MCIRMIHTFVCVCACVCVCVCVKLRRHASVTRHVPLKKKKDRQNDYSRSDSRLTSRPARGGGESLMRRRLWQVRHFRHRCCCECLNPKPFFFPLSSATYIHAHAHARAHTHMHTHTHTHTYTHTSLYFVRCHAYVPRFTCV